MNLTTNLNSLMCFASCIQCLGNTLKSAHCNEPTWNKYTRDTFLYQVSEKGQDLWHFIAA